MRIQQVVSEKAAALLASGKYLLSAGETIKSKISVRQFIEKTYSVRVESVNRINLPAKVRVWRGGRSRPKQVVGSSRHRFIVTLKEGYTIDEFKKKFS